MPQANYNEIMGICDDFSWLGGEFLEAIKPYAILDMSMVFSEVKAMADLPYAGTKCPDYSLGLANARSIHKMGVPVLPDMKLGFLNEAALLKSGVKAAILSNDPELGYGCEARVYISATASRDDPLVQAALRTFDYEPIDKAELMRTREEALSMSWNGIMAKAGRDGWLMKPKGGVIDTLRADPALAEKAYSNADYSAGGMQPKDMGAFMEAVGCGYAPPYDPERSQADPRAI